MEARGLGNVRNIDLKFCMSKGEVRFFSYGITSPIRQDLLGLTFIL
jgi:hypothetical protein